MNKKDLAGKLKALTTQLVEVAEDLMYEANTEIKSEPRQITLIIPLGMFAGTAIDTIGLKTTPKIVYVGEKRMGGITYTSVRLTVTEALEYDEEQWTHVGSNTFVWKD